jgi:hypothetical protein
MAGKVVYTCLYTDLCLRTPPDGVFDVYASVNFGSTYSSLFASASFGVDKINTMLSEYGKQDHETASYILSIEGIPSCDGTVLPLASGTFVAKSGDTLGYWSGSSGTDGVAPYIKASQTGSVYDEGTDLSADDKTAYLWIKAVR